MNETMKKSDSKYDVLKLVLSLFVVAIHSKLLPTVLYPWLRVAVPLFFMMSSYFLFSKLQGRDDAAAVKRYAMRNLKLYLFWFILLLPITLFVRKELYFYAGMLKGGYTFVTGLLFGSTFVASWYIMASVFGTLIVYFLSRKLGNKLLLALFLPVYLLIVLRSGYFSLVDGCPPVVTAYGAIEALFGNPAQSVLVAPFWITCGKCFAERTFRPSGKLCCVLLPVSCALLYGEWHLVRWLAGPLDNDHYLMLPLVCIFAFGGLHAIKEIELSYGVELRRCSTVIYTLHGSALVLIKAFCTRVLNVNEPVLFFTIAVVVCVGAYLILRRLAHCRGRIGALMKYSY